MSPSPRPCPAGLPSTQEHGVTQIATIRPTALLSLFNNPDLAPVAQKVEEAMSRIMQDLT